MLVHLKPTIPEELLLCYCNNGEVESEYHVLFNCEKYDNLRQAWLAKISKPDNFIVLSFQQKFNLALNEPCNVKHTAQYLIAVMDLRRLLNTQY